MTDSHCHLDRLNPPESGIDPELRAIVTVGAEPDRNEKAISLAAEHPNVWAVIGLHPADAEQAEDEQIRARIAAQASRPGVVAIGETGFDTHWNDTTPEQQQVSFDFQAEIARAHDLPLVLHVRDRQGGRTASAAACAALVSAGWERGILHCFNGDDELLKLGLELGWYVSFAGNVTFKNALQLQESAKNVPLDRLLVETDSPFLAPVPKRGKPNRPGFVRYTAEFIAGLRGTSVTELERATDRNAEAVFRFPAAGRG